MKFAIWLLCIAALYGQDAQLTGLISDASKAVVPKAEVTVANNDTGVKRTVLSNHDGYYTVPLLPPGSYLVTVRAAGFQTEARDKVMLEVEQTARIDFTLRVGTGSQTVTVLSDSPLLQTESAAVGTVVDRKFVENIPLNGRSFQSLIMLTPGVVVVPSASNTGQFSVNGQRSSANNFTVDGVSANFGATPQFFGGPQSSGNLPGLTNLGTTQSLASVDALQEFKVETSTYSAEYGRQPGGQISIVTRSGTNQYHGNMFDYLRNDLFDANDWFADRAGQPKPPERQNDFGATLGGPVAIPKLYNGRNRTFFFFSYEGMRLRLPQFNISNVPTLCLRGLGSCPAGQSAGPAVLQPLLNAFPLPNGKDLGNGLAEFNAGYSDSSQLNATSVRIDHTINSKLTLFGRFNNAPSQGVSRNVSDLNGLNTSQLITRTGTVGLTASITPKTTDELKVNYSENGAFTLQTLDDFGGAKPPPASALIVPGATGGAILLQFPNRTSTGAPTVGLSNRKETSQRSFNILDNFSYTVGSHQLKFGIDYRRLSPIANLNAYGVNALFLSQAQVLANSAGTVAVASNIALNPIFVNFSAYAQDAWKISHRLTLDFGLRWDVNPAPSEANGHEELALNQISNFATTQLAPIGTKPYNTTYRNFAPRVGLAYQLSQAPGWETVVRGGFGIFFDTGNDYAAMNFLATFPYTSQQILANLPYPFTNATPTAVPVPLKTPYPFFNAFDPALKLPYTWQWNGAVEQALGKSQALTVSYVGAAGRRLLQSTQLTLNGAPPINPNFTTIFLVRNNATSDYDALQARFQRHLSQGLQALVSYTWSHALDDDSASLTGKIAQRGNASFDVRHIFATALTYDIPAPVPNPFARAILGHWSVDTSLHAQSAFPIDLVSRTQTDPVTGDLINIRPNVNLGVPVYIDDPNVPGGRKINAGAFSVPAAGQSGNFGRNQVRGLGAWQVDFAVRREFKLMERLKLQFRGEAFNVFNHPNFGSMQTLLTASNFGQPTGMLNRQLGGVNQLYQIGGPRSLQMAIKLLF